jgi:PIN domain nuclease of toxin-antitoxin system
MSIDPSSFHKHNITDTCAVWNVLSSAKLYIAAKAAHVKFYCTYFVIYECLYKARQNETEIDNELKSRLEKARSNNDFQSFPIDISDLQTIQILQNRKRLGKGELASIAFAIKTQQAFLTDDKKARKLAKLYLNSTLIQTSPHLLGWLFFINHLIDSDLRAIIAEHSAMDRPLGKYFQEMYQEACRCRLLSRVGGQKE